MYHQHDTIVFLNGRFIPAYSAQGDLYSQSMHYGNGIFDGLRAYNTPLGPHIFKAKEHFERLAKTAEILHVELPYSPEELTHFTYELLDRNQLTDAYIRPLVYFGSNMKLMLPTEAVNVFLAAWKWGKYLGNDLLDVTLSKYQRHPKTMEIESKITGQYVTSVLATTDAKQLGYDEAILTDTDGCIACGSVANIFFEKDGILYTPPRGSILPGITRATVFEMAEDLGIEVQEALFTPEEFAEADGAFFAGTAAEISGIRSFNGQVFNKLWKDTLGHTLFTKYRQIVTQGEYNSYSII